MPNICEFQVDNSQDGTDTLSDVLDIFAAFPSDFMIEGWQDAFPQEREFERVEGLKIENWLLDGLSH